MQDNKRKEWKTVSRHGTFEAADDARKKLQAAGTEAKVRRRANNSFAVRIVARTVANTDAAEHDLEGQSR